MLCLTKNLQTNLWDSYGESLLSSIIADVIQDLEEIAIRRLPVWLFYFRYMDEHHLVVPSESINDILKIFNSLHIRLQFTMKVDIDGLRFSFLDIMLLVEEQSLVLTARQLFRQISILTHSIRFITRET